MDYIANAMTPALWLVSHLIPVLALSLGTLPKGSSICGHVVYTATSVPTFPQGSAALYVLRNLPQHPIGTRSITSLELMVVAVKVTIAGKATPIVSPYFRSNAGSGAVSALSDLRRLITGRSSFGGILTPITSFGSLGSQSVAETPWFLTLGLWIYA